MLLSRSTGALLVALTAVALATVPSALAEDGNAGSASKWALDASHSTIGFTVSHLFTSVQGRFDKFEGSIEFDPANLGSMKATATADSTSINTNNAKRDKHLRSDDFFDVENFPTLSFQSTGTSDWSGKKGKLLGDLTIHGVTKPVAFDVKFLGQGSDPWGNVKSGFQATVTINRKDYGLNWNQALEAGGVLVGEEIEIRIDAEANLDK